MKKTTTKSNFFQQPPRFVVVLVLIGIGLLSYIESSAQYTVQNSPIGGGGFVTGIFTHPTSGDRYCRTDVGGAYRWDAANNKWVQLLDWLGDSQGDLYGVESLALDPQNPNNVYMLCGTNYTGNGKSAILKSTDKGNTFTYTNLTDSFKVHGNGSGRGNGERLAVDPHNSNILFCGTRANGLWKSTDAGVTWNKVWTGVTTTTNGNGICLVLFDPSSSVVNGATQTFYVGVSRTGGATFYKTTNGGASFTDISPTTTFMPHRAALQGTTMYVTYSDTEGPATNGTGKVYKLNTSTGAWTDVTPNGTNATPGAWSNFSYGGVSIDPANVNRVVISTCGMYQNQSFVAGGWGDFVFFSTDGGTNWTLKNGLNATWNNNGIGWVTAGGINWMDCIEFDKSNPNIVRHIGGGGVFTCSDITATNPSWKYDVIGIEETAWLDGVSIPGGPLITSFGDVTGFVHNHLTSYPSSKLTPSDGNNQSIAYAGANTSKVVRASNGGNVVYYSSDMGATWTGCATNKGTDGKVAISADGGTFLYCPRSSSTTYYTTNNGGSWSSCSGVSLGDAIPVGDMVNANYFYIYNPTNGQMLVSSNKGVSFSVAGTPGKTTANYPWESTLVRAVPGYAGHVWVPLGMNGLQYSTDYGATFTNVANVTYCRSIGIGVASGSNYPTVFIWGTVSGVTGLFRSTDQGTSWTRINDDAHQFGGASLLIGDMNVFGRVYMASNGGRGVLYWDPTGGCTPTAITPYMQINSGTWQQISSATVVSGDTIKFGPQPATGGSWSWSGPNGFTVSTREISISNIQTSQAGNYVATYTNDGGCQSTQTFVVTIPAPCTPTAIVPYVQVNGGTWQQVATASVASGGSVMFGPQPTTGGSWSWSGPNGYTASTREITISNIQTSQAGNYVATYTNATGCQSTQTFSITLTVGPTGTILREYWTGITGTSISNLTSNVNYPNTPSGSTQLTSLEAPTNWADNYGTRIRGYIYPTTSGSYTFWVAGDEAAELYLSTTDNPANITRIAYTSVRTNSRAWTRSSTQKSSAINLTAGQRYYIEVLHKEGTGNDNVAVAWQGPGITQQVISGSYLSPFVQALKAPRIVNVNNDVASDRNNDKVGISLYPNPANEGNFTVLLPGTFKNTVVRIYDNLGKLLVERVIVDNGMLNVNSGLNKGIYIVRVSSEGKTFTEKLIVK